MSFCAFACFESSSCYQPCAFSCWLVNLYLCLYHMLPCRRPAPPLSLSACISKSSTATLLRVLVFILPYPIYMYIYRYELPPFLDGTHVRYRAASEACVWCLAARLACQSISSVATRVLTGPVLTNQRTNADATALPSSHSM